MASRVLVCAVVVSACAASSGQAAVVSLTDLWDVSQGCVVDTHTGVISSSNPKNMFGANISSTDANKTVFRDYAGQGGVHAIEWHVSAPVTVRSINLVAFHDGGTRNINYRGTSRFELFYKNVGGSWQFWYGADTDPDHNLHYGGGPNYTGTNALELCTNVTPVTAQYFRATFAQAGAPGNASGPRIEELDALSTYVPEPASVVLLAVSGLLLARRRS